MKKMVLAFVIVAVIGSYYFTKGTSEFLLALQTIVLVLTGLVIYWYTLETQKIREASFQQNQIMGDQLRVMQETFAFQMKQDISKAQPILQPAGYMAGNNEAEVKFRNLGATVQNLSSEVSPQFDNSINPRFVSTNEVFSVRLPNIKNLTGELEISISYDDQYGSRGTKKFIWDREKGTRELRR